MKSVWKSVQFPFATRDSRECPRVRSRPPTVVLHVVVDPVVQGACLGHDGLLARRLLARDRADVVVDEDERRRAEIGREHRGVDVGDGCAVPHGARRDLVPQDGGGFCQPDRTAGVRHAEVGHEVAGRLQPYDGRMSGTGEPQVEDALIVAARERQPHLQSAGSLGRGDLGLVREADRA
jgi:hypothetical protein